MIGTGCGEAKATDVAVGSDMDTELGVDPGCGGIVVTEVAVGIGVDTEC